jgi:Reverse transcriptase (RNA-dependent DNA polymerase)/RNase H-like domain found in reverse transcriptase/Integrase core domain/Integrase zinc binding domain
VNHIEKTNQNNSAYVRVKIRNRPIVAKMLIDSGNLVNDLISEEFAKTIKAQYTPIEKSVGTAAKGGSVKIIGRCEPIKLFIENVPRPVIIRPFVVKDLSHPLNVGRDFLGRNEGKLEYTPSEGYLDIRGHKVKMIRKSAVINEPYVTDARMLRVFNRTPFYRDKMSGMIFEGEVNSCEELEQVEMDFYCRDSEEIPACSARFVNITTRGKLSLPLDPQKVLMLEPCPNMDGEVLVLPEISEVIEKEAFCCVINPEMHRVKLEPGQKLGTLSVVDRANVELREKCMKVNGLVGRDDYPDPDWLKELKLEENMLIQKNPWLKEEVINLFKRYEDIVSKNEYDYGHTDAIQCQIQLKEGEETPVKLKARPLNPAQEESLKKQLEEWEEGGIIEKTQSPWAFPMVGVKKKNSNVIRWCVDYRLLNKKTVKDAYPLSSIESNLHKLQGSKIFSTLDSAGAYHSVEIHPESREYTAFITPFGQYQFARMPFGLSNAGACYSRLVSLALQYLPGPFAIAYLDDVVIHSKDIDEHLEHLEQVLSIHRKFGMKLRLKKCKIFQEQVEYLGHLVSQEGIRMVPAYVQKILEWPLPQTGKQLKQFLGFIGYYRSFIPDVADLTFEMNDMKKANKLIWSEEVKQKFEKLKSRFETAPLRVYPDYNSDQPFILDTDFSSTNLAAVLSQVQNGKERFIGAGARKCNNAERNYPSHKGELAAAVMGMRKFEHILRFKPFILRTDSRCMQFLDSLKDVRGIYYRWLNFLQGFDFQVVHRPGVKNQNADPLSRLEHMKEEHDDRGIEEEKDMEEDVYVINPEEVGMTDIGNMSGLEVLAWQESDPVLKTVIGWVKAGVKPGKEEIKDAGQEYRVYAGVFECLEISPTQGLLYKSPDSGKLRVCLPTDAFTRVFRWAHEHPTAGHFGMTSTQKKIKERFFLPGLANKVITAVTNCINCVQKRNYVKKDQHIFHRSLESRPFQKVYVDIVGPLPAGKWRGEEVTYILTMMDGFTKWTEAVPIKQITGEAVAQSIVDEWIARYGIPEQIHSDRGAQFTGEIYQEVMRLMGVTTTVTPPYNPRSNKVERFHRILGEVLRSDQSKPEEEWPEKLPLALFAYRTAISRTTGVTPFQALFGVNSRVPLDVIFPTPRGEPEKWPTYVENLKQKLQDIYEKMRETGSLGVVRATAYQSGKVNRAIKVEIGDTVYYFSPRVLPGAKGKTHRKLALLWTGPYRVKKVISDTLCVIYPFGEWARNPREIVTVVDKLRLVKNVIPERVMRPEQQVDMDDIEEDLENYGEYIQQNFFDPPESRIPTYVGAPAQEILDRVPVSGQSPSYLRPSFKVSDKTQVEEVEYSGPTRVPPKDVSTSPQSAHGNEEWESVRREESENMEEERMSENEKAENVRTSEKKDKDQSVSDENEGGGGSKGPSVQGGETDQASNTAAAEKLDSSRSSIGSGSQQSEKSSIGSEIRARGVGAGKTEEQGDESSATEKEEGKGSRQSLETQKSGPIGAKSRKSSDSSVKTKIRARGEGPRTKYEPYKRESKRKSAVLAEALLKAGASMEKIGMDPKSSDVGKRGKRKMSEAVTEPESKRKEAEREEGSDEEIESDLSDEEEIMVIEEPDEELGEEGNEQSVSGMSSGNLEYEDITSEEENDDLVEVLAQYVRNRPTRKVVEVESYRDIRFPERVREVKVPDDEKGRVGIVLAEGDVRNIAEKIAKGATSVKKVIHFRKVRHEPVLKVNQKLTEEMVNLTPGREVMMSRGIADNTSDESARFRLIEACLDLDAIAQVYFGKDMNKVTRIVGECLVGPEEYYKPQRELEGKITIVVKQLEQKELELQEKMEKIQELETEMRNQVIENEKLKATVDRLNIRCRNKDKEMERLNEEKERKGEVRKKEEKNMDHIVATLAEQNKQIQDLHFRLRQIEKPQELTIQVKTETLVIPKKLKHVRAEMWGEISATGLQIINEWGMEAWCAVSTCLPTRRHGIRASINGADSFKAGRARLKVKIEYDPKEVKEKGNVVEEWSKRLYVPLLKVDFPSPKGRGPVIVETLVTHQEWKEVLP